MSRDDDYSRYQVPFDHSCLRDESFKDQSNIRNDDGQEENNFLPERHERRTKKNLKDDEVENLQKKKKNLEDFIHMIGDIASHPIRQDILEHCGRLSDNIPQNPNKALVMKLVKNRVDKMIKNKRIKKNWSQEDINILVWVISKYCQYHGIFCVKQGITEADWNTIANMIPGVNGKTCMFKWLSLKKSNLAQNGWVQQESLLLDEMVKNLGQNNWCLISQELYLKNTLPNKVYRCPKQCREHWNCYLNPSLKKGPWEKKQDYLLLRAVKQLQGVKKWAEIVKLFNGRTQNALKNRFTLIVQKETKDLKNKKKLSQIQLVQHYLKRHETHYSLDEPKLKFLSQKRNLINETQAKRKPKKKTKSSKCKKIKQLQKSDSIFSEQQEEQYMPGIDTYMRTEKISKPHKATRGGSTIREEKPYIQYQSPEPIYERDDSINNIRSVKKTQKIFYSSDSQGEEMQEQQSYQNISKDQTLQEQVKIQFPCTVSSPLPQFCQFAQGYQTPMQIIVSTPRVTSFREILERGGINVVQVSTVDDMKNKFKRQGNPQFNFKELIPYKYSELEGGQHKFQLVKNK